MRKFIEKIICALQETRAVWMWDRTLQEENGILRCFLSFDKNTEKFWL